MMDKDIIEKGIEVNDRHIQNVINNIDEDVPFVNQIIDLGFESLEDFFNKKTIYEMQNALNGKAVETPPKDAIPMLEDMLENKQVGLVYVINKTGTCVHAGVGGKETHLNEEYCNQNGIPIYPYSLYGGNIVSTLGDFDIGMIVQDDIEITCGFMLNNFKEILSSYFDDMDVQGNDLLIDNKKAIGTACLCADGYIFFIAHFSMSAKPELIENICGVPLTGKEVGCIDTDVLSVDELSEKVLSWLQGL